MFSDFWDLTIYGESATDGCDVTCENSDPVPTVDIMFHLKRFGISELRGNQQLVIDANLRKRIV